MILNLPDRAKAGKRLRCPKCGLRFVVTESDAASESTLAGPLDADPAVSGFEIEKPPLSRDDLPLAMADRDLRETFELPLASGRDAERQGAAAAPAVGDAAALFQDHGETRRRPTAGDAGSRPPVLPLRRPGAPGHVDLRDLRDRPGNRGARRIRRRPRAAAAPPSSGPPMHVAIIGGLLGTGALILLILSLIKSVGGAEGWQTYGWLCLALVAGFGVFAVVQFIRLKSAKLLMVALTLGVVVNLMVLIVKPLVVASLDTEGTVSPYHSDDPNESGVAMQGWEDRLDLSSIKLGITFLVLYAVLAIYLMSPAVRKPFQRANATSL